jgi:hypothetical protein
MDLTPEQIEELFTLEVPNERLCLHEARIEPTKIEVDGENRYGYIARLIGHGADGKSMIIDFVTTESVLQETCTRFISAGMQAAMMAAMDDAKGGDVTALVAILTTLTEDEIAP